MAEDAKLEIVLQDDGGEGSSRWASRGYVQGSAAEAYNEARRQHRAHSRAEEAAGGPAAYVKQAQEEFRRWRTMGAEAQKVRETQLVDSQKQQAAAAKKQADDYAKYILSLASDTVRAAKQAFRALNDDAVAERKTREGMVRNASQAHREARRQQKRHRRRQRNIAEENRARRRRRHHEELMRQGRRSAWRRALLRGAQRYFPAAAASLATKATGSALVGTAAGTLTHAGIQAAAAGGGLVSTGMLGATTGLVALGAAAWKVKTTMDEMARSIEKISPRIIQADIRRQIEELGAMRRRDAAVGQELGQWEDLKTDMHVWVEDLKTGLLEGMSEIGASLGLAMPTWHDYKEYFKRINWTLGKLLDSADWFVDKAKKTPGRQDHIIDIDLLDRGRPDPMPRPPRINF